MNQSALIKMLTKHYHHLLLLTSLIFFIKVQMSEGSTRRSVPEGHLCQKPSTRRPVQKPFMPEAQYQELPDTLTSQKWHRTRDLEGTQDQRYTAPCEKNDWQTLVKTLLFLAVGNDAQNNLNRENIKVLVSKVEGITSKNVEIPLS